ncbi:MAG TPA: hypothetical protein VIX14_15260 [Terriglobales bacterium]
MPMLSRIFTARPPVTFSKRCTTPLGQRISTASVVVAFPSSKCRRKSLCEMYPPPLRASLRLLVIAHPDGDFRADCVAIGLCPFQFQ